ncbi:tyrosine--tRNA ligase [Parvibacter caecicola]|uniref:Tyrosine--tRNA ligase n=2 Tax=Parvibacter caecicola TaxID=747645 RepID=A0A3N0AAT4_9ACTN|nr:tyrosine--tRNA ligase [Parvibacter caecicola]MBB3170229.1 tyrosyl-tRNA synthetase [Parvibacter caecicola]MCR2041803.1 tyrosine--tRNA ligase [Parvibacter caecicola]RNL11248.1 tyrosine--tRNA ligase [Parvibacter caecicola]TJW11522.1 tyrosine--tRNA ligase [Parvibacter caecicola]
MLSPEEQLHIIASGAAQIVPESALLEKLKRGNPLNIKLGVDPTAPDIHLGHAVPLRKLRQFQDLGHQVTLIIGDGTALIGDPSGRNSTRPQLSRQQIQENAQTYVDQAFKVLDPEKTTLRYNSEWILALDMEHLLKLLSNFTVARILERDDFHNRYANSQPISLHEFLYPVMQAYDSVVIKADVELGGTDQLFNLLAGRELMEKMGMEPQVCLTLPLLEGTDGVKKMSKSYGNYIGLTDEPNDMFGKVMSIPDPMIVKYYRLASNESVEEIDRIEAGLAADQLHPNKVKRALARNIVSAYYDDAAAQEAEAAFDALFKNHDFPEDAPQFAADLIPNSEGLVYVAKLLHDAGLAPSVGEARRLIDGGGVKVNGEALPPKSYNVDPALLEGAKIQVGKRKFLRLV